MFLLMQVIEVALRLALVVGFLVAVFALWVMLTGNESPLRAGNGSAARAGRCLGCDRKLQRVDVVNCSKCLGV